jgi:hypothetical protein
MVSSGCLVQAGSLVFLVLTADRVASRNGYSHLTGVAYGIVCWLAFMTFYIALVAAWERYVRQKASSREPEPSDLVSSTEYENAPKNTPHDLKAVATVQRIIVNTTEDEAILDKIKVTMLSQPVIHNLSGGDLHLSFIPLPNDAGTILKEWIFTTKAKFEALDKVLLIETILHAFRQTSTDRCIGIDVHVGIMNPGAEADRLMRLVVHRQHIDEAINSFSKDVIPPVSDKYSCHFYSE